MLINNFSSYNYFKFVLFYKSNINIYEINSLFYNEINSEIIYYNFYSLLFKPLILNSYH